jgi:hypothetical protein
MRFFFRLFLVLVGVSLFSFRYFSVFPAAAAVSVPTSVVVTVIPNAPSDLVANATSPTQVELSWTDNSTGEDGFSVERKTGVGGVYAVIATTGGNVATYVDNSVAANTTYFYRVRSFIGTVYSLYSNESSVTTPSVPPPPPPPPPSSGSSGGGSFSPPSTITSVVIEGSAYPLSKVIVLKDGQIAIQTIAGPDALFSTTISNLSGGTYSFSVYAQDDAGRQSTAFTFPVTITPGATTVVSGVFLAPTIDVDKSEVKRGDTLVIFGKAVPNATVNIQVHSSQMISVAATSTSSGAYLYDFDTSVLAFGSHAAKAKAIQGALISNDSAERAFMVGTQDITAESTPACPLKGDLNGDCRVNLIDFSILAYWYLRPNPPAKYDLNGDGKINLVDFSIMAYYWTG